VGRDVRLTRDLGAIVMDLGGVERISTFLWAARTPRRSVTSPARR
jgi:hypothetical protein